MAATADGLSPSVKIRGSLKTVWADEEDSESTASTDNRAKQRAKLNGWLARSRYLVRQETEDLYCDDELHPSLENDPNMQLSIAQQHAEQVKPYPPMPMLTDRGKLNYRLIFLILKIVTIHLHKRGRGLAVGLVKSMT